MIGGSLFFTHASQDAAQDSVKMTYVVIAFVVIAIALLFKRTALPDIREAASEHAQQPGATLWQQKHFVGGVIAQFFYVAAQVGVGAFFINYATEHWHGVTNQSASYMLSVAMICFMLGRFFSTWLMGRVKPAAMLAAYALINIVLCATVMLGAGDVSVVALIAIFFFMSTMFPTIFAMGVKNLGPATKQASSFMIMAIVGGAIMPYFMGLISDHVSTAVAYGLPLLCFAVVLAYALRQRRHS